MESTRPKRYDLKKAGEFISGVSLIAAAITGIINCLATVKEKGPDALAVLGTITYDAGFIVYALMLSATVLIVPGLIVTTLQHFLKLSDTVCLRIIAYAFLAGFTYNSYALFTNHPLLVFVMLANNTVTHARTKPGYESYWIIFTQVVGVILLLVAGWMIYNLVRTKFMSPDENKDSSGSQ